MKFPPSRAFLALAALTLGLMFADSPAAVAQTCVAPPSGMVAWYPGDGHANDIQGPTFENGTPQGDVTTEAGKVGRAFKFSGVGSHIQVGPASNLVMTSAVTIDAWIYPTGAGSGPSGLGGVIVNKEGEYEIVRFADGTIAWAFANTNPGWAAGFHSTNFVAPLNQWTHIAVTYNAGVVTTYADGVAVDTFNGSGDIGDAFTDLNDFRIGNRQELEQGFDGLIDEVEVFNRALSQAEVQSIYNAGTAGKCKPGQQAGDVIISEFRTRGPGGSGDDFFELFNTTESPITVGAADASFGWGFVTTRADGEVQVSIVIPNGTVIPARGHYLVAGPSYSLTSYAASEDLPRIDGFEGGGVALFRSGDVFTAGTRLDSVGFTTQTDALFREGAGIAQQVTTDVEHSYVRKLNSGRPQDTGDNAADFVLVATSPAAVTGSRLGAPGPQNSQSPIQRNDRIKASLIEPMTSYGDSPNSVRIGSGSSGTFSIRRRWTNMTTETVTRLRFRIVDVTAGPAPAGTADLRATTSGQEMVSTSGGTVTVEGTTLEEPPAQPNGGGLNATLAAGTVTTTPLIPGESVALQFLLNVAQPGAYRFYVNVEATTEDSSQQAAQSKAGGARSKSGVNKDGRGRGR